MHILTTNGITISVQTRYLPSHSDPFTQRFIFGYHITIENNSPYTVQLLRRQWVITDATGLVRHVEGEGVIGIQPVLEPGVSHAYTSSCDLLTEIGKMSGSYQMVRSDDGSLFDVVIPEFYMCSPVKLN